MYIYYFKITDGRFTWFMSITGVSKTKAIYSLMTYHNLPFTSIKMYDKELIAIKK